MSNQFKLAAELTAEIIRDRVPGLESRYVSYQLDDPEKIKRARQMATAIFVKLGKISPAEVGEDGVLIRDAILPISTFFGCYSRRDGSLLAANRLLWTPETTIDSLRLPVDEIDPEYADYLRSHEPGGVAEIGSLAKADRSVSTVAVLRLLQRPWMFASEHSQINTFICGLEPRLLPPFQTMFGNALTPLTEGTVEFPGIHGPQRPLMIDVRQAVANQDASNHRSPVERLQRFAIGHFIAGDVAA